MSSAQVDLDPNGPAAVAVLEHKGMFFEFSGERVDWWWQEMVAQLDEESMRFVLEGEEGRRGGLIG